MYRFHARFALFSNVLLDAETILPLPTAAFSSSQKLHHIRKTLSLTVKVAWMIRTPGQ